MGWSVSIIAGIAVGLAWLAIWILVLRVFGITVFSRQPETRARMRERIQQLEKLEYILMFGVLGFGLACGLAIGVADLLAPDSHGWVSAVGKLVLISVMMGWFHGARTWNEGHPKPVPFPPNFRPMK